MEKQVRTISAAAAGYTAREEDYQGRKHLVVPVVALVEGVIQAMNAPNPEFVSAEEFSKAPGGWNGRPIFLGHPLVAGEPVSGNTPELLEKQSIGIVFNAAVKNNKLTMEAWIDVAKAEEVAPDLLARIAEQATIEISVGVFMERGDESGEYKGKDYVGAWTEIVPDHLALLEQGDQGACSVKMGCGVRAAEEKKMSESPKTKLSAFLGRVMSAFRSAQPAEDMTSNDLQRKLYDALRVAEPTFSYVEAYRPVQAPTSVVYSCYAYGNGVYSLYERPFTLAEDGTLTLSDTRTVVEAVLDYIPVTAATETPTVATERPTKDHEPETVQAAALDAPCACRHENASTENKSMPTNKEKALAALNGATEEQATAVLAALETKPAAAAVVETPAPVAAAAAAPVVEAPKQPTLAELIAAADPDVRESFNENVRAAKSKREATIAALKATKRCGFSDEQLNAMQQAELDNLVALAGVEKSNARVDYSGQAPRAAQASDAIEAPQDLAEALRTK
jgi:hypothetical protein